MWDIWRVVQEGGGGNDENAAIYLPDEDRGYLLCLMAAKVTGVDVDTIYWSRSRAWVNRMLGAGTAATYTPPKR